MEMHENKNAAEAKQADRDRELEERELGERELERRLESPAKSGAGEAAKEKERESRAGGKARARKNNLKKLRLERMMSKAELARRAGVSTLTIDRVERGLSCRMDTKRKILEALGLKPSDRVTVFGEDE